MLKINLVNFLKYNLFLKSFILSFTSMFDGILFEGHAIVPLFCQIQEKTIQHVIALLECVIIYKNINLLHFACTNKCAASVPNIRFGWCKHGPYYQWEQLSSGTVIFFIQNVIYCLLQVNTVPNNIFLYKKRFLGCTVCTHAIFEQYKQNIYVATCIFLSYILELSSVICCY